MTMQYAPLGRTGLKVSRLCLGTMNFGPETCEPDSHAIMDRAIELGLNFFDTADVHGWKKGEGWTEQIIGPRTREQLTGTMRSLDLKLDPTAMKRLDEIWPGPGGPAPEAYSW